ncbi:hypothetical protein GCM10025868_22010 [Angustibacter aerolatus]|uniref:Glycosyl hydrolase family 13 catalytic domain-containing protein n=1 Tax=Angustibacter aerolatus TaxID=1162965 RepID=A0ABQ6JFH3_9ACTN|nr:alpha-amylase family glycosyl hydrolase [Angustibacter aerolatus]GMA86951.1 hypothetical protein GCM10025868_22010 [Angustibacter aerolatus]
MPEPAWVEHAIWWHVYPLGFLGADTTGADRTPRRTLRDLVPWLDHAISLGCNGILLGPVFASSTHGYDTTDHLRIDERLGDEADFDALVAGCRERGLRLMLDGVFNHVGRDHRAFQQALRDGPDGATAGWFDLDWSSRSDDGEPGYRDFEGHHALVALRHGDPGVRRW